MKWEQVEVTADDTVRQWTLQHTGQLYITCGETDAETMEEEGYTGAYWLFVCLHDEWVEHSRHATLEDAQQAGERAAD